MSYQTGDLVIIQSDISISGETIPLVGLSGTVSDLMQIGLDVDNNPTYRYDIALSEPVLIQSGLQSLTTLWMTQEEINGTSNAVTVDVDAVTTVWQTAIGVVEESAQSITNILSNIDRSSRFYDNINSLSDSVSTIQTSLTSMNYTSLDSEAKKTTANTVNRASELLSFDSTVFKELAENLYGYYQLVDEAEQEAKVVAEQASAQSYAAAEDDLANYTVYKETFVTTELSSNILIPQSATSDPSPSVDFDSITSDVLIPDSLKLEQD